MHKTIYLGPVLAMILTAAVATASDCTDQDTVDTCTNAIAAKISDNAPKYEKLGKDAVIEADRALSIATTGDISLNAFGSEVSLNDFLNVFNIAVDPGTESDDSEQISLEYSPTEGWLGGDFKLGLSAARPALPDPIKNAINDSTLTGALENEFTLSDDVTITLGYSFMGRVGGMLFGRSADAHQDLLNALVYEAKKKTDRSNSAKLSLIKLQSDLRNTYGVLPDSSFADARVAASKSIKLLACDAAKNATDKNTCDAAVSSIRQTGTPNDRNIRSFRSQFADNQGLEPFHKPCQQTLTNFDFEDIELSSMRTANCIVNTFVDVVVKEASAEIDSVDKFRQELAATGFFKISSLVNNQSQLVVSASARSRNEQAGGDEFSVKAALEWDMSGHNINNLNTYLKGKGNCLPAGVIKPSMEAYQGCSASIADYTAKNPVKSGGWRVTASLEYTKSDALDLTFPGSTAVFQQDEAKSLVFSLVGGRQYDLLSQAGLPKAKLDIGASYADVSSDPMRQDRAMANITFTQQMAEAMQLSIGVVWANKPEYRGDTDSELSARLGLNYKFGPTETDGS